jgi:hypothetical protein
VEGLIVEGVEMIFIVGDHKNLDPLSLVSLQIWLEKILIVGDHKN